MESVTHSGRISLNYLLKYGKILSETMWVVVEYRFKRLILIQQTSGNLERLQSTFKEISVLSQYTAKIVGIYGFGFT